MCAHRWTWLRGEDGALVFCCERCRAYRDWSAIRLDFEEVGGWVAEAVETVRVHRRADALDRNLFLLALPAVAILYFLVGLAR